MPATINNCLNNCGDCGRAYQEPGCKRTGTKKSLAPSGVERVRYGVSISKKSDLCMTSLIAAVTVERNLKFFAGPSRLKSKYRYLSLTSSEIFERSPLSTGNGSGAASLRTSNSSQTISISPVAISLFSFPAGLAVTLPVIKTHHSARNSPATFSSLITT